MPENGEVHTRPGGKPTLSESDGAVPPLVDTNCTYVQGPNNVLHPQTNNLHVVKQNPKYDVWSFDNNDII